MRAIKVGVHLYQRVADSGDFTVDVRQEIIDRVHEVFDLPQFSVDLEFLENVPGTGVDLEDATLRTDLRARVTQTVCPGTWFTRLLIARSSIRSSSVLGVMFDSQRRSGAGLFMRPIQSAGFDPWLPLLIRTMCHELGHVFHLAHEDGTGLRDIMNRNGPTVEQIQSPEISARNQNHLLTHDERSVQPDTDVGFGLRACRNEHDPADFSGLIPSSSTPSQRERKVSLELRVERGRVYPDTSQPTFVIGEPVYLSVELVNSSKRSLALPRWPETATQDLIVYRIGPEGTANLLPPNVYCHSDKISGWSWLRPGEKATFHENLLFRNGELVFPREGTYQLIAGLRLRGRWLVSEAQTVRVAPPLKKRHENACETAADPEAGLFVELGGAMSLHHAYERLERLSKANPKFPLNRQFTLLAGREAVLSEDPTPAYRRKQLTRLAKDRGLPAAVRAEAELLLLLDRSQGGDRRARTRLRRRLADELHLPIPIYAATLIRRRLDDLSSSPPLEDS